MSTINDESDDIDEVEMQLAHEKAVAALIAKLEASGHAVQKKRSGGFLVSRWGMTRHAFDFESLRYFAKQVGAI